MEKYYFEVVDEFTCTEQCQIMDYNIGSAACQECQFCVGMEELVDEWDTPSWIKCKLLWKAKKHICPKCDSDSVFIHQVNPYYKCEKCGESWSNFKHKR